VNSNESLFCKDALYVLKERVFWRDIPKYLMAAYSKLDSRTTFWMWEARACCRVWSQYDLGYVLRTKGHYVSNLVFMEYPFRAVIRLLVKARVENNNEGRRIMPSPLPQRSRSHAVMVILRPGSRPCWPEDFVAGL
jgi:hypothetical protein